MYRPMRWLIEPPPRMRSSAVCSDLWLRYQGFDAATLAPDELADWRDMFDKGRKDSLATPKVGLMKLPRLPGEHRYAVAVR